MGGNISPFKPFLRYRYPLQILCLEDEIYETMDLTPAHILLDARKLVQELQDFYQDLKPEDMRSMLKDSMLNRNPKLLQQIYFNHLAENSGMEEGFTYSLHEIAAVKSQFFVGLEKSIGDLKRPLFQKEVPIVGVRFMGGVGETTLALALWNDVLIKESPNGKGLLETMWDGIVGRKRSEFQNLEDACMQLQIQLMRQSKSTLLILDNVGSRANLGKLLFHVTGYKTLFTKRDTSIIPRNYSAQYYQLPLLVHADALSLFIFWASGQMPIPSNGDANPVNKVQAEYFAREMGFAEGQAI
ncbi:probable disease resistance protein At4g33300 isoform X2 [Cryptomeria japonica]|uniref:probable disease resistance protein At4g33300 isoform X2 n=1 Tax=Cryptomeria japonica TaxID=3369 RepID=UPI0025AC2245|nr:probable disease resistance protein At4g33300 isoform X2 [Cryptomeria japonica]